MKLFTESNTVGKKILVTSSSLGRESLAEQWDYVPAPHVPGQSGNVQVKAWEGEASRYELVKGKSSGKYCVRGLEEQR